MPKGDESVWDIRGDLSFVHLYCTDAHLRRVGEEVWDRSPANFTLQEKTFASDDKITSVYRQFLLANDWRQPANQLTLSAASSLLLTHLIQHYSTVQWRLPSGSASDSLRRMTRSIWPALYIVSLARMTWRKGQWWEVGDGVRGRGVHAGVLGKKAALLPSRL